ncbi:hypothetical protein ACFX2J_027722 [Malus domestica]
MSISEFRDARVQGAEGVCPKIRTSTVDLGKTDQWQKLGFGTIKINTDAAWCKDSLRVGVGWVARDFAGVLQTAGASGEMYCHSALAAEAVAIRQALEVCGDNGFDNVIVQSDAKVIIQMIRKELIIISWHRISNFLFDYNNNKFILWKKKQLFSNSCETLTTLL